MHVHSTITAPLDTDADTIAIGVFDGKDISHDTDDGALQALLESGEAKRKFKHLAVTHAAGKRFIVAGLGDRDAFDVRRARTIATAVHGRAKELGTHILCWELPHHLSDALAGAIVDGTVQAAHRFDRYKKAPEDDEPQGVDSLIVSDHDDRSDAIARATAVAYAVTEARDLQDTPANDMTPTALAQFAQGLNRVTTEVLGRDEIVAAGMGAFAAVAQGSYAEPQLITMRYEGPGAQGPLVALVGKAVTFDTGGISIKPSAGMEGMKFDMSGGAAVVAAVGAIAQLELPVRVLGVVGATENMPSGRSMRPGDIVKASNGTSIEINNTDAEGRLVLSDCLCHAIDNGAERIIDLATLTGAIMVALGSTFAGLMASDDDWAQAVQAAGDATGERVWRMPLDDEYDEMIKGRYADITNLTESRKAGSITAAQFLKRFTGDVPWAHLDIAGTSFDTGSGDVSKGGNGFGVRLLVELVSSLATRR
jgi:leucyl aminopeptidase